MSRQLRPAGEEQARGTNIEEVCRKLEIGVATYHRWNKEYSGWRTEAVNRKRGPYRLPVFLRCIA